VQVEGDGLQQSKNTPSGVGQQFPTYPTHSALPEHEGFDQDPHEGELAHATSLQSVKPLLSLSIPSVQFSGLEFAVTAVGAVGKGVVGAEVTIIATGVEDEGSPTGEEVTTNWTGAAEVGVKAALLQTGSSQQSASEKWRYMDTNEYVSKTICILRSSKKEEVSKNTHLGSQWDLWRCRR
jgi:hypothetical protein